MPVGSLQKCSRRGIRPVGTWCDRYAAAVEWLPYRKQNWVSDVEGGQHEGGPSS